MSTALYFLIPMNMLVCIYFTNKLFSIHDKKSIFLPLAGCFLTIVLMGFLEFQILTVSNVETIQAFSLNYMIAFAWSIYLTIISCISFRFPKSKYGDTSRILKSILTIPIIFFTYTFLINKHLDHVSLYNVNGSWVYQLNFIDPIGLSFLVFIGIGLIIMSTFYWKQFNLLSKENRQSKIFWIGILQTLCIVAGTIFFVFNSQKNGAPFLISFASTLNAILLTWIFSDFKFNRISASLAFHDILHSMSTILIVTNRKLEIVEINKKGTELLHLNKKNVEGIQLFRLIRKLRVENWRSISELILKSKDNNSPSIVTKIMVDDQPHFINVSVQPHYNKKKKLIGYILLGSDVTELNSQKVEIQEHTKVLERTNKELERFAYIASHDLKTPLRSVVSFLDLIERKIVKYDDKDLKEFVYLARQGASQMYHLIKDILEFSRVDKINSTTEKIDLNETLLKVCYSLQPAIAEKDGEILVSNLPSIRAEKTHMIQLFSNLVENGFKYNKGAKPKVEINHRHENNRHVFAVSDNGIGVEPQYYDQIFEMFKRLHTNPDHEGSGIGLSICKKIVDIYEGEIWLESKVNEGTTFFFTLAEAE